MDDCSGIGEGVQSLTFNLTQRKQKCMQSLWNDHDAQACDDDLDLRVYSSRLLGQNPDLVLHGGGNTSVKITETNLFGEEEQILYVKGSGWDLATIERRGFSPVKLDILLKLAELDNLTDTIVVQKQRAAMTNPDAPNPSVEAILHAAIPHKFVDHTHADAIVTQTNIPNGEELIRQVYGSRVLIIPYIMPGFPLAQAIYRQTRDINWQSIEAIILMNHGIFTFADDAKTSYENMIRLVTEAETYLQQNSAWDTVQTLNQTPHFDTLALSKIRKQVSDIAGKPMIARLNQQPENVGFASREDVESIGTRGLLTPDHVIRTKRIPVVLDENPSDAIQSFASDYRAYFERHNDGKLTMLDPAPRYAIWKGIGTLTFGETVKASTIAEDVVAHTIASIQRAEALGGWQPLDEKPIFDIEYWELEQAKLKRKGAIPPYQGRVALVTGAANGIGKACAEVLHEQGAVVVALDIQPQITEMLDTPTRRGIVVDMLDNSAVREAIESTVKQFGGLDMVVSNVGAFPKNQRIEAMDMDVWNQSLALNLTSHQQLLKACIPYLKNGIEPAVVLIGSKNFPAPGPGASAYSVTKAGLTQLGRVAALELAGDGIRVNVIHPDAVFDTALWTDELLQKRAEHYGMSVQDYKTKNLLGVEITSLDVALLVSTMLGQPFSKTTGAQVPIDGGNERVI